jgi:orotate phosphoribosyltransferase
MAGERDSLLRRLRDLVQQRSIRQGSFTLASGVQSDYYCDTKATVLSPEGAKLTGEILFDLLDEIGAEAVGGLAMGAAFLGTAVALVSEQHGRPIYAFTVRENQKAHGLKKEVEESFHPDGRPLLTAGRRVAVVDDVVTKGGSILKAIELVRERQCEIVAVIALVDRNQGGGESLHREFPYFALFDADSGGNLTINEDLIDPGHSGIHRFDPSGSLPRRATGAR